MTLTQLQTKLQTLTGTSIAEVIVDSDIYFTTGREKQYPFILWMFDSAKFDKDYRTSTIQEVKIITMPAFIIINYDHDEDDKFETWDTIEGYFKTYINKINELSNIQIFNIDALKGIYIWEGERSPDKELGIMFPEITIKMFC